MRLIAQSLQGVWLVQQVRRDDPRGHFARTFCGETFAAQGLPATFVQCNVSFNTTAGTLRGLHWQDDPYQEGKLVRCTSGAIFDVAVDLRVASPTRGQWLGVTLAAATGDALYIPPGFAHGFQALQDATEVFYQMTERYQEGMGRGLRWDSPALQIAWPLQDPMVSSRDAALPVFVS